MLKLLSFIIPCHITSIIDDLSTLQNFPAAFSLDDSANVESDFRVEIQALNSLYVFNAI